MGIRRSKKVLAFAFQISLFSLAIIFSSASYADDKWKVEVAPYLWAINMKGTVQTGPVVVHVNESFTDILSKLRFAGMLWIDAHKCKVGFFANALYSVLKNEVQDGPFTLNATNKFSLFSAGASYEIYKTALSPVNPATLTVEPYVGFRYTDNDVKIKVALGRFSFNNNNNQHWIDPIIGARAKFIFTPCWSLILSGDVGGTNTTDHYSYNLAGLLGYHPQTKFTNTTVYFGYRLLDQHYETGSGANFFKWNMKIFGPVLGVAFAF